MGRAKRPSTLASPPIFKKEMTVPAESKKQQMVAGMAEAIKEGKMKPKPGTPSAEMAKSMKPADLQEFASTPRKGLPMKVKKTPTGTIQKKAF